MIYKIATFLLFLLVVSSLTAQNFKKIDRRARNAPEEVTKFIPDLVEYLTQPYESDIEKVRSLYAWIAYHIEYDKIAYKKGNKRINKNLSDLLKRRKAVCLGYSILFVEMCKYANIPAQIVEGYPKNLATGSTRLDLINHAWNAVKIDGNWQLLDITWASDFKQEYLDKYFLPPPEEMIQSHLPADPMWQLLDCPVPPAIFKKSENYIKAYLGSTEKCFSFQDSIQAFRELSHWDQKMKGTLNAYQFNPVKKNEEAFGHIYMDQVAMLTDLADELERQNKLDTVKIVHLQIIDYCQKASRYINLYDHHKENLAYSHMNYAVALSRELPDTEDVQEQLQAMLTHFEKAQSILQSIPTSFVIENSLSLLDDYLEWTRSY